MQFSTVLSLVFATAVAAQNQLVATLFSEPGFQGSTLAIKNGPFLGQCNAVASFPNVQSIQVTAGFACTLYNTADCKIPYAAYGSDSAATLVNGAFAAYQCGVEIPGGPFSG